MCLGIPGKVVEVYSEFDLLMGKVDFGGVIKRVCLECTPEIRVGDYAVIHVGFAISRVDEEEARRVFAFLQAMDELDELRNLSKNNVIGWAPLPVASVCETGKGAHPTKHAVVLGQVLRNDRDEVPR